MTLAVVGLIAVPLLDQVVKLLVRRLHHRSISLGPLGALRVTRGRIWMMRVPGRRTFRALWALWALAAVPLLVASAVEPRLALFAGLVLGGSLSHAVEMSLRGSICDYVCLRFWPAFDLADVALAVGTVGTVVGVLAAASGPWS
jgi:lipoprotein signal peptidase